MSDTLFRYTLNHRARSENREIGFIENDIVDELTDVSLTDSSEKLGGAAEITIGPLVLSFNRVILKKEELHLKGPMGRTVARVGYGTDQADSIIDFVESHDEIKFGRTNV